MEQAILGRTGRKVSRIGFGGAPAGLRNYLGSYDPGNPGDRESALGAVRRAWEKGITYFDTAPGYGDGESESILGEALVGLPSAEVFLATKVGVWEETSVARSLEGSLRRLRRGYVDLLQLHGTVWQADQVDRVLRPGGQLEQMEKLREDGLVRAIGFTSECENEAAEKLLETGRFDALQVLYNLLFQHPCDPHWKSGTLIRAEELGMGIITMRALTSGAFQNWMRQVRPDDCFDYGPALLQFPLSNPLVDVVLVGMRSAREVEQNAAVGSDTGRRVDLAAMHRKYL